VSKDLGLRLHPAIASISEKPLPDQNYYPKPRPHVRLEAREHRATLDLPFSQVVDLLISKNDNLPLDEWDRVHILAFLTPILLSSKFLFLICISALVHFEVVQHGADSTANRRGAQSLAPVSQYAQRMSRPQATES
jgi:hypothetical protein